MLQKLGQRSRRSLTFTPSFSQLYPHVNPYASSVGTSTPVSSRRPTPRAALQESTTYPIFLARHERPLQPVFLRVDVDVELLADVDRPGRVLQGVDHLQDAGVDPLGVVPGQRLL